MFEKRSEKQLIIIYAFISLLVTFLLSIYHLSPYSAWPKDPILVIIAANIEFFCIFYVLYLPIKVKKGQK